MKINAVTFAIILALSYVVVVTAQTTHPKGSQSRSNKSRGSRNVKAQPNTDVQAETSAVEAGKKIENEIAALSKLTDDNKVQIRVSIEELHREITRAKLGDRLAKSIRKLEISTGGNPFASLQKHLNESLALLPPKGITAKTLLQSWDALNDFLILEIGAENNVVTNNALKIIQKYDLKGDSVYLMSIDVLDIALFHVGVAFELVKRGK